MVAGMAAATGALLGAGAAHAAPVPQGLSITLTDGIDQLHSNMSVTYTATVANAGPTTVNAILQVAPPAYVKIVGGTRAGIWHVTVAPDQSATRRVQARVDSIAKDATRVTALASVYLGSTSGTPVVRTADADHIRGVADRPVTASTGSSGAGPARPGGGGWSTVDSALVAIGGVLVAGGVSVLVLRRRRRRTPVGSGGEASSADAEGHAAGALS
jgi:hypothetical protein